MVSWKIFSALRTGSGLVMSTPASFSASKGGTLEPALRKRR